MAVGGSNNNNPLTNLFRYGAAAPKNNNSEVTSNPAINETEETQDVSSSNDTNRAAQIAARLRAESGDSFGGVVGLDKLSSTKGADSINRTSPVNNNLEIAELSELGEPASVTVVDNLVSTNAALNGNPDVAFGNSQLLMAARMVKPVSDPESNFNVESANSSLKNENELLALVGNA